MAKLRPILPSNTADHNQRSPSESINDEPNSLPSERLVSWSSRRIAIGAFAGTILVLVGVFVFFRRRKRDAGGQQQPEVSEWGHDPSQGHPELHSVQSPAQEPPAAVTWDGKASNTNTSELPAVGKVRELPDRSVPDPAELLVTGSPLELPGSETSTRGATHDFSRPAVKRKSLPASSPLNQTSSGSLPSP